MRNYNETNKQYNINKQPTTKITAYAGGNVPEFEKNEGFNILKLSIILLTIILGQAMIFAAPAPKADTNAWQKLDRVKMIPHVSTYYDGTQKVKKRLESSYIVQLKEIRQELEKAGIDEPVGIEVRYNSRLVTRLGIYEPTISIINGKKEIKFNSIPVGKRIYTNLTRLSADYFNKLESSSPDSAAFSPRYLEIYFKNKNNKTKARVCVSFLKVLPY